MGERLFRRMPETLDWRDEASLEGLLATADALIDRCGSPDRLLELEWVLARRSAEWPLAAQLAVKLARSKLLLRELRGALRLSVVVPVFREHARMLRPHEHPLGEGLIDRKLRQLRWLLGPGADGRFDLWIVDDGCPEGSGEHAREIVAARHADAPVRILFLADAIAAGHPATRGLHGVDESQKGGAVHLGLHEATERTGPGHVVLYTDADLSTHLGQTGLLVSALAQPGARIAAGSRRSPTSIVVKSAARSARGRLFIYLWKKLLPELAALADTQCGFKALAGPVARRLVTRARVRDFAFDLELLLLAELERRRSVAPVPIGWIDSEAASTTVAVAPYLAMLRRTVELRRRVGGGGTESESFARAIEAMDEVAWQRAVAFLGPRLETLDTAHDRLGCPVEPEELVDRAA